MNRSFYLLLVFGFSMAVSGGLETLGAVFGLGVGIPRLHLDNLATDTLFALQFALIFGVFAALWVALRQRNQEKEKEE